MTVTVRSEVRIWPNASKIDDCTQNYLTIPKKLISDTYNPGPGSIVTGKIVAVSIETDEDIVGGGEFSSVIRDIPASTRIVLGQGDYDYLFIFTKDWKKISKKFTVPGRKFLTYSIDSIQNGRKKERIYHGNTVYWEENDGTTLE